MKSILLDVDYFFSKKLNEGFIVLLLKGKKGLIRRFYRFDPYLLLSTDNIEKVFEILKKEGIEAKTEKVERFLGNKKLDLFKLILKKPSLVPKVKKIIENSLENVNFYEYDIPIKKRFLIDEQITPLNEIYYELDEKNKKIIKRIIKQREKIPKIKAMSFDIEVYNPQVMPNPEIDKILMISCKTENKAFVISTIEGENLEKVKDEKEMLMTLDRHIEEIKPDVLFGYNSSYFDLPYISYRAKILGTSLNFLKKMKKISKGLVKSFKLRRIIHIDLYHVAMLLSLMGIIESEKLTLSELYKLLTGKEKFMINRDEIWKYWEKSDKKELVKYSIEDAVATFEIGKTLLPLEIELAKTTKTTLFDVSIATAGQLVENALMFFAYSKKNLIMPRPKQDEIRKRLLMPIKGGFVKLPNPGLYDNVAVLDFRGLYPSIIVSYNIDPYTITEENDENVFVSPIGVKFKKEPRGLLPSLLDEIITKRAEIKKMLKKSDDVYLKARSQALKILANSFYGYLGYARSRWYSRECAESITAWGREHIKKAAEEAEKQGFEVLYIDTDSLFLLMKDKKKEDVIKFVEDFNKKLPEKMELEIEDFYKRALFVSKKIEEKGAKKKYALLAEDGKIKIRGFELVRRDWSDIARETQKMVLETILKKEKEIAIKETVKIVKEVIEKIRKEEMPIEKFVIRTKLNKDLEEYEAKSPELSAAKKLKRLGRNVGKGSLISYVITKNGLTISEKAYPAELANNYDPEYYIRNQVLPAVMKILKELGIKEQDFLNNVEQRSLAKFFD